jgi:hypothetical protein
LLAAPWDSLAAALVATGVYYWGVRSSVDAPWLQSALESRMDEGAGSSAPEDPVTAAATEV